MKLMIYGIAMATYSLVSLCPSAIQGRRLARARQTSI